tara:strand:- start:4451 stop:5383 length:933 start_codon:yes stop_codon:yes gene_type:complete
MSIKWVLLFLFFFGINHAQIPSSNSVDLSINSLINGTLLVPSKNKKIPLAIIIQGSGPTDRDGNQQNLKNNSLKYLAKGLYKKNIATFRYDKRFVKQVVDGTFKESEVDFNDFIKDAVNVIQYFKEDQRFSQIIIIGHSQGSLVGMIASQEENISKFISLAGAGQEIDDVIIDQLEKQAPALVENARQSFDDLRVNGVAQNYSPLLASIFRPSLQPFMLSWMKYNPQTEISKLTIPVLIINGDNDFQVQVSEAEKLKAAKREATLIIIPKMNHIFKETKGDLLENQASYNKEEIPISKKLIKTIYSFILK